MKPYPSVTVLEPSTTTHNFHGPDRAGINLPEDAWTRLFQPSKVSLYQSKLSRAGTWGTPGLQRADVLEILCLIYFRLKPLHAYKLSAHKQRLGNPKIETTPSFTSRREVRTSSSKILKIKIGCHGVETTQSSTLGPRRPYT